MIVLGSHAWETCSDCGKLVKLTGWLRGLHLCLTDEERQQKAVMLQRANAQRLMPTYGQQQLQALGIVDRGRCRE
jgi:hypothetical protein